MGPGVPNPETAEGGNTEDDLIQTPNVDRDKMMLFSFIKHVILGKMNKETQNGPTQHTGKVGLEPPTPCYLKRAPRGTGNGDRGCLLRAGYGPPSTKPPEPGHL